MKRFDFHKAIEKIGFLIFAGFTFFGCKTAPVANHVNPLDLLDGESAIYFAIPSKADTELMANILQNNISGLSEKDVNTIIERIDTVYAGLLHSRNQMEIQCAASCNIPTAYHSKIFSKKNGWTTSQYIPVDSIVPYKLYSNDLITLSLPDSNTVCLGRDVTKMIDTYQILSSDESVSGGNPNIDEVFYDYLNTAKDEIRFFAQKPQSFLTMLTGANLDLKLIYVMGEMKSDPKLDTQYILDLNFEFKNERYVKPGKALLSLSFGLTDSDNIMISPTNLQIKGIKISKKQLYKILTFK